MDAELEQLQKIGAQKIHEQTHIPLLTVQAILHGSYDNFSRIQFLGFISILEREYKIELVAFKEAALAHFEKENKEGNGVFVVPSKKSNKKLFVFFALFVFIVVLVYEMFTPPENETVVIEDSAKIEKIKKRAIQAIEVSSKSDENRTKESNTSVVQKLHKEETPKEIEKPKEIIKPSIKTKKKKTPIVLKPLKIKSKSKVWFGYIDTKKNKKYQKTFRGTKELNPKKAWLLIFGHGFVDIYVDGKLQKFPSHPLRFFYKDGVIKPITAREFKRLNRGHKW